MRGLKRIRSATTIAAGHAFVENLRRGHYELTVDVPTHDRVRCLHRIRSLPLTPAAVRPLPIPCVRRPVNATEPA